MASIMSASEAVTWQSEVPGITPWADTAMHSGFTPEIFRPLTKPGQTKQLPARPWHHFTELAAKAELPIVSSCFFSSFGLLQETLIYCVCL